MIHTTGVWNVKTVERESTQIVIFLKTLPVTGKLCRWYVDRPTITSSH